MVGGILMFIMGVTCLLTLPTKHLAQKEAATTAMRVAYR